ncbi:glycosyltransferase family 4 protein [bacterium]|nr:glycosyltransferase family 4 protein [bacterium]
MTNAIVYLTHRFPCRSETFVYREVQALRRRGRRVLTVCLNAPEPTTDPALADLAACTQVLYGRGRHRAIATAAAAAVAHPLRAVIIGAGAVRDAFVPREPLSPVGRVKVLGQAAAGLALSRLLRPEVVGHIHCHFGNGPTTVGMYAASHLGVPFSFTGHAHDLFRRRALLRRKLGRAAFVACISEWHRAFYQSLVPEAGPRLRLIRCGVDTQKWSPEPRAGRPPGGRRRVLTVCRLVEKKGVDTLIRALAELRVRGHPAVATIAGDGPLRGPLQALARVAGCGDAIEWVGAVENAQVRELVRRADMFVLPCRTDAEGDRDGIPVALMEAMACGLPVIAGDLPAVRELVDGEHTGLIVPANDAPALAAAMQRLMLDAGLAARLAAEGRVRVAGEFSLSVNIARLEEAIDAASVRTRREIAQANRRLAARDGNGAAALM